MRFVLLLALWFLPAVTQAAVVLSEVAWMGSTASANHEWIELHNTGSSAVDITGWKLEDGMNLSITLTGTIPGGAYVVLERSSDASAPGTAFLIYTGALVNTGATLTLERSDGSIEDQVAGGTDWQSIGGDNVTKETAQYTESGWVTGTPTPGNVNAGTPREPAATPPTPPPTPSSSSNPPTPTPAANTSARSSRSETTPLILGGITLKLAIKSQSVGYVNQAIDLDVTPSGVGKTIADSLSYQWNFGDGNGGAGKETTHRFAYPGTYIITVHGSFKRQEQLARHEITILPVTLSVTKNPAGDIQINNDSPYEIDISGYRVSAQKTFRFRPYSLMLPNQTITIPKSAVGSGVVRVFDTEGTEVISSLVAPVARQADAPMETSESTTEDSGELFETSPFTSTPSVLRQFGFATAEAASEDIPTIDATSSEAERILVGDEAGEGEEAPPPSAWPYVGLVGIIILGLASLTTKTPRNQTE